LRSAEGDFFSGGAGWVAAGSLWEDSARLGRRPLGVDSYSEGLGWREAENPLPMEDGLVANVLRTGLAVVRFSDSTD